VADGRTVKTASSATAVQIAWSSRRGSRNIEANAMHGIFEQQSIFRFLDRL